MSAGGGGGFFQRVSNFFHPGGGQGVGLAPPQAGYPGAAHHQQQQHQQGQPGNPYAPVAYPPPQMHRKTPTFAELLYRAMLRRGPEKKEKIQEAFRYLKQHPGLPQDEVLARLASALGENFVSLCWKEARIQLYEAQRAAGQQGGGQQGFGPFGGGGGAGGGRGADEEAVDEQVEEQVEGQELAAMHDGDDDDNVTDEAHVKYEPSRVKGGVPHPGYVVETKALAGVIPTPLTFKTRIPRRVVEAGKVSLLQLEAAMYGMQMHERRLPSGERAGWVLADGTGIGAWLYVM